MQLKKNTIKSLLSFMINEAVVDAEIMSFDVLMSNYSSSCKICL